MIPEEVEKEDCGEAVYTLAEWLELSAQCGQLELENKRLRGALMKIAEGRGYIEDSSTIYMNGKHPLVPKVFNARDMQRIAQETLIMTTLPQT